MELHDNRCSSTPHLSIDLFSAWVSELVCEKPVDSCWLMRTWGFRRVRRERELRFFSSNFRFVENLVQKWRQEASSARHTINSSHVRLVKIPSNSHSRASILMILRRKLSIRCHYNREKEKQKKNFFPNLEIFQAGISFVAAYFSLSLKAYTSHIHSGWLVGGTLNNASKSKDWDLYFEALDFISSVHDGNRQKKIPNNDRVSKGQKKLRFDGSCYVIALTSDMFFVFAFGPSCFALNFMFSWCFIAFQVG